MPGKHTFVILAAGGGKRLWPLTAQDPKPLVRVLGRTLLDWLIEGLAPYAERLVIVVGTGREQIQASLADHPHRSLIRFAIQDEPKGTGHALLCAQPEVPGDFILLNGDNFYDPAAFPVVARAAEHGWFAFGRPVADRRQYGVFEVSHEGRLLSVLEKPPQPGPGLANLNLFSAPARFFDLLRSLKTSPRGELEVTDALNAFAQREHVHVHRLDSFWADVGFYWSYNEVNQYAATHLARPAVEGTVDPTAVLTGPVHLDKTSVIKNGTRLEGPVWIGPGCTVGPNAFLRSGVVLEGNNRVGTSEIKNSTLLRGACAPHDAYVGDSVLGEDVNLGAGTKTANLRFDHGNVKVTLNDKVYDSGLAKLGVCLGKGVQTGVNANLMPGTLLGPGLRVKPGEVISGTHGDRV